jgi:hypothetical protein
MPARGRILTPSSGLLAGLLAGLTAFALPMAAMGTPAADATDDGPDAAAAEVYASSGPIIARGPFRPTSADTPFRACSTRRTLCVQGARTPDVLAGLASAERAWDTATGVLDLPAPDPDPRTGAYDIYLVDRGVRPGDGDTGLSERDTRGRVDRASAFSRIDARARGCSRDFLVARELLHAILFRVAPAMDEGSARAQTTSLAELVVPCAIVDTSLFQSHPERALVDTWVEAPPAVGARYDEGAALVYDWIDTSFGAHPGAIVRALWALSPSVTAPAAWRWNNEPDSFEVLRASFKNALSSGSTVDDLWREISVARAFADVPARRDWSIDWPAAPRRLAGKGVAPTGAAYVEVRHATAPKGAGLRVEIAWEQHAKMRWAVVKVDANGKEIGHLAIPTQERATETQMTVVDLEGVASIVLVGANAGDPLYPFDPDDEIWEPHGWMITVASAEAP